MQERQREAEKERERDGRGRKKERTRDGERQSEREGGWEERETAGLPGTCDPQCHAHSAHLSCTWPQSLPQLSQRGGGGSGEGAGERLCLSAGRLGRPARAGIWRAVISLKEQSQRKKERATQTLEERDFCPPPYLPLPHPF